MADDDRIARAAQRFFDTITFTLKLAERPEIEGIKNYKEEKKDEKEVKDKKRTKGIWKIGEILNSKDLNFDIKFNKKRILISNLKGTPVVFCSILNFQSSAESFDLSNSKNFHYLDVSFIGESNDHGQLRRVNPVTRSFGHLLRAELSSSSSSSSGSSDSSHNDNNSSDSSDEDFDFISGPSHYDPIFLDDPNLKTGKHRTVLALPSFLGSISHYISRIELKRELNDQFRQKHPDIHPSLTLSQIRSLKQSLLDTALALDIELSTVAKSYAYFEKLLLCGKIIKMNRKIVGACALILAIKVNDSRNVVISDVLDELCGRLHLPDPQQIIYNEFAVFSALKFSLHLPQHEYMPHFDRIFSHLEFDTFQEYLGEKMYRTWKRYAALSRDDDDDDDENKEEMPIVHRE